ncbi:putative non-specific serine/threonine protein kinase [Helianthus annuus]|nr:putative non-specific serine/threonine protein kinase [Helianthus annuus]
MLTFLDLSSNRLNGSLPESLGNLTSLAGTVNLSWNEFSGEIPASYGLFPVMVSLDLRGRWNHRRRRRRHRLRR